MRESAMSTVKLSVPARQPKLAGSMEGHRYMAWLATQPPLVSGPGRITIHHVRRFGAKKDDRRTIPLPESRHLIQHDKDGTSIEALGFEGFERHWKVNIEAAIKRYRARYERLNK